MMSDSEYDGTSWHTMHMTFLMNQSRYGPMASDLAEWYIAHVCQQVVAYMPTALKRYAMREDYRTGRRVARRGKQKRPDDARKVPLGLRSNA